MERHRPHISDHPTDGDMADEALRDLVRLLARQAARDVAAAASPDAKLTEDGGEDEQGG